MAMTKLHGYAEFKRPLANNAAFWALPFLNDSKNCHEAAVDILITAFIIAKVAMTISPFLCGTN